MLVYSRTPEERACHKRKVLEVLRRNELYAKLTKCEFWLGKVVFLGDVVSNEGISVDPQKIEVVPQWPRCKNVTEVRSFLGFATYYHKFVQRFSKIATPLINLTKRTRGMNGLTSMRKPFRSLRSDGLVHRQRCNLEMKNTLWCIVMH